MLLNLTDQSSESLQKQIIRQLRAKILTGELSANSSLPSIRIFSREHHISVITVQRAYENLLREGFIQSRRSKGFFVSELTHQKKKKIAKLRLLENLEPIINISINEGLTKKDVCSIFETIIEKYNAFNKKELNHAKSI